MLKVFYGSFHPDLEDAFARRLGELAESREPVAVVAPSRGLADRLERLLAVEKGQALLGVHFHTFHSLAVAVTEGSWGGARLVGDPILHDRIVDGLLARQPALDRFFGGQARPRALAGALRSSLRDLIDAGVSPENLDEFFGDELPVQAEERERLRILSHLGREYEARLERLRILSPSALTRLAVRQAETSSLLAGFREIIYYGFYDLTGLQLEFFEAVASRCPTRLYFPYRRGHPAFRFAEPFFEQKLLAHDAEEVPRPAAGRPALEPALDRLFGAQSGAVAASPVLRVLSVSGARDEAWAVAKEILRLAQREGRAYEDIGVVARSLEPYRSVIAEVFGENAIPCDLDCGEPLLRHPLAKTCLNLLTLRLRDFPTQTVEDLFSSPYFVGPRGEPAPVKNWRLLLRHLGVQAGWLQWRGKLEARVNAAVELNGGAAGERGEGYSVPQAQVRDLWDFISGLEREFRDGTVGSWWAKSLKVRALVEARLRLPAKSSARERAVWDAVMGEIASLAEFDLLQEPCGWRLFLETLVEKLRLAFLRTQTGGRGVRVRDAMSARGESFKILFLIGLKEKSFPRAVREDPLLRDRVRAVLRHPAGYWIAQKSAGYEEERLLFYLMTASAREKLFCVFPRSDEAGRAEVPSLYLRDLCRAAGVDFADSGEVLHVPRQPAAKFEILDPGLASAKELFLRLALEGKTAADRLPPGLGDAELFDAILARASKLGSWGKAGPWDAMIGPGHEFVRFIDRKGLSPSALDMFAACPFRFFASRVLGLGEPPESSDQGEFPAPRRGRIYHEILERFYAGADESLWSEGAAWQERLQASSDEVFARHGWQEVGVYPLLWIAVKEAMSEMLRDFLAWDRSEIRRSGLRPARAEARLEGTFREPVPPELARFQVHGIADRIDRGADGVFRIVDYKTHWTRTGGLRALVLAGKLHQLPIYAELAGAFPGLIRLQDACIYALEDSPETTGRQRAIRCSAEELAADRAAFLEMIVSALRRMRAGRFCITPEDGDFGVCSRCPFPLVCRKSHGPSRTRAANGG
ncbi:MAG TPA: hypothetical protein DEB40_06435 [Elusimicrobia bacterium]|nr:hypothetical protein [Elusimicrobiota bacterium]HBT61364.1 hypothetical protein [Elusimicrobiota bacterium]